MADTETTAPKAEAAKVETPKVAAPKVEKIEKAAEKVTESVAATVQATTEAATSRFKDIEAQVKTAAEKAQAQVKTATEKAKAQFEQAQAQMKSAAEKAGETAKAAMTAQRSAVETVVKAGQIYGEGLQGLVTHAAEVNRVQFDETMAHLRALTSVKSVKQAVELQSKFARSTASRFLTEGSSFVEDYLKVAHQALSPVTAKAREAAEKVKQGA